MKHPYSIWIWGLTTMAAGAACLVWPHLLTALLALADPVPDSTLLLARLAGLFAFGYGFGYVAAAAARSSAVMRATVLLRAGVLPLVGMLVVIGWLPAPLIALGLLDAAGALWTHLELRGLARTPGAAATATR